MVSPGRGGTAIAQGGQPWVLRHNTRGIKMPKLTWAYALPPYVIGSLAIFWVVERTVAFFP